MSSSSLSEKTARGFQPPHNTQFSVFLQNRVGQLLELVHLFEGQSITLAGLSIVDSADHAVVRVVTSNSDLARRLLQRYGMASSEAEVLAVELPEATSLTNLCRCLLAAEVNIHYAYPLLVHPRGLPAVVLHTDDILLSGQICQRKLFTLLAENDMGGNAPRDTPGTP
jgi:hypothetical protein